MRLPLTISLTTTLLSVLCSAACAQGTPRSITVFGSAERWVEPDIAVFDITIERRGEDLGPLHTASNAELARVLQITAALDVPRDRVAGGDLNTRLFWRLSAARSIQQDLKLQAVQVARDKAEAMATALGMRLGAPLIISEWPIVTDAATVEDRLSREAGITLRLKPERIKLRETAYVRFELMADPIATVATDSSIASSGGG